MLSLLFPAFGTAMFVIEAQMGLERLALRHALMGKQLQNRSVEAPLMNHTRFNTMRKWINHTAELMVSEVSDWRLFVKVKGSSKP